MERTVFGMGWKGGDSIGVGERMEEVQPCPNVVSDCEQVKRLANRNRRGNTILWTWPSAEQTVTSRSACA